jgi:uncharacterized membrane protein YozB (DUF420 family)
LDLATLPLVNACLNGVATLLLIRGRILIARGAVAPHRRTMLAAFGVSTLFLALYVAHKVAKGGVNTPYHGEGAARIAYLAILFSHIPLAATVPVFAIRLIVLGLRGELSRHRRLAGIAWPIWLYVSLTGVVIYLMLYPFNPQPV